MKIKHEIMNISQIRRLVVKEIEQAEDLKTLNEIYKKYLGKKGEISRILRSLKELSKEKRIKIGQETNKLKREIEEKIKEKKEKFLQFSSSNFCFPTHFDITAPGKKPILGHLHPLTLVRRKIEEIFQTMGFSVIEGPEIETEWHNFDALNIPAEHPSRSMWDTFWIKSPKSQIQKLLLRCHTSPVQIRYMQKNNPPLRIIAPGRVFRYEATDASHEHTFYQIEGLMVDKNISLANLKGVLETFMRIFFGEKVKIRWQPSYFPFVEPGLELLMACSVCQGKGCSTCGNGWLEVIPCGMVHPNVFKAVGYIPRDWQGFAFGIGMDRLAMMKYKINDIRLFYSGDLRFLNQF